jgi:L-threonylcarbamoyladenylate synthase
VSTSANVSGEPTAATFSQISDEIKSQVDYIVKSKQRDNAEHEPSSVIKLGADGSVKIIRK